jgi:hypothetical protein
MNNLLIVGMFLIFSLGLQHYESIERQDVLCMTQVAQSVPPMEKDASPEGKRKWRNNLLAEVQKQCGLPVEFE